MHSHEHCHWHNSLFEFSHINQRWLGCSVVIDVLLFISEIVLSEFVGEENLSIMQNLLERRRTLFSLVLNASHQVIVEVVVRHISHQSTVAEVIKDAAEWLRNLSPLGSKQLIDLQVVHKSLDHWN